jgi:hypothetical protein
LRIISDAVGRKKVVEVSLAYLAAIQRECFDSIFGVPVGFSRLRFEAGPAASRQVLEPVAQMQREQRLPHHHSHFLTQHLTLLRRHSMLFPSEIRLHLAHLKILVGPTLPLNRGDSILDCAL